MANEDDDSEVDSVASGSSAKSGGKSGKTVGKRNARKNTMQVPELKIVDSESKQKKNLDIKQISDYIITAIKQTDIFFEMRKLIQAQSKKIDELVNKIEILESKIADGRHPVIKAHDGSKSVEAGETTYAHIVKKRDNVLIIKPNEVQDNEVTRAEVRRNICPSELKIGIKQINNIQKGGMVVKCSSKDSLEKLAGDIHVKLGDKYKVTIPGLKKPKLKIVGLESQISEAELIQSMKNQNDCVKETAEIKLITTKKMKTRWFAIVECDPKTFSEVVDNGALCIGYSACAVYEYLDIVRCFRCSGFNHLAKECSAKQICFRCGHEDHTAADCINAGNREMIVCPNCDRENRKGQSESGTKLDTCHPPFSNECKVLLKKREERRSMVDYGKS